MGNCVQGTGDNSDPDPKGIVYTDVPIDGTFEHPTYCDYCTEGRANCSSPEFMPAGNGAGRCACRGLCNDGCCRKLCKRVSYLGDPTECCAKSAKSLGHGKTCDPKYRSYKTNDCDTAMDQFCSQGDNLFSNPNCTSWFNQRLEAASATLETVCNKPENITKPQCGCILARKEMLTKYASGTKIAVECIDNRCTNGGWKTYQMSKNPCNVVNCEMNISDLKLIANAPVGTYNASFVQQCKNEQEKIEAGGGGSTPIPPTPSGSNQTTLSKNIWIGGGVTLFIIIIIMMIYFLMGDD